MPTPAQLEDFFTYLRFPTISADPGHASAMSACVEWLHKKFSEIGFSASIHPSEGPPLLLAKSAVSPKKKQFSFTDTMMSSRWTPARSGDMILLPQSLKTA